MRGRGDAESFSTGKLWGGAAAGWRNLLGKFSSSGIAWRSLDFLGRSEELQDFLKLLKKSEKRLRNRSLSNPS
jgi:hypothetical protein